MTGGKGKFAPKLTFEQRCGYYYASVIGIPRDVITAASGLNRGTITRLINRKYRAYDEVHLKFDELGKETFRDRYYTKEVIERLSRAAARGQAAGPAGGAGV